MEAEAVSGAQMTPHLPLPNTTGMTPTMSTRNVDPTAVGAVGSAGAVGAVVLCSISSIGSVGSIDTISSIGAIDTDISFL